MPARKLTIQTFNSQQLPGLCDQLAAHDPDLRAIIDSYGYPPFWTRPNNYETLVWTILEQQVSLASAKATLKKLRLSAGEITPDQILKLSDEDLRSATLSRQKASYVRHLAAALQTKQVDLDQLASLDNQQIRQQLIAIKGIGNWTIDMYLIMVLHRRDIFPSGDIAAVNTIKQLKDLPSTATPEQLAVAAEIWRPLRTIATFLLWHHYLSLRNQVYL